MPHRKRDANEPEIVTALKAAGCGVKRLDFPDEEGVFDLLVGRPGLNMLMEVKTAIGRLSPGQVQFQETWPGPLCVVRSPIEALQAMGIAAQPVEYMARSVAQTGRVRHHRSGGVV